MKLTPRLCTIVSRFLAFTTGLCLTSGANLFAITVNLPAVADTTLNELDPNNNVGANSFLETGTTGSPGAFTQRRALVRFDLSAIPAGSTVHSATLTVAVVFGQGSTATFQVHRVLQAWGEGNKSGNRGSLASTGEATWNSRMHGSTSWSAGGAEGDYTASPSATTSLGTSGSGSFTGATIMADVQAWVNNSAPNNGWILRLQNEAVSQIARRIGAREGGSAAQLAITYTPPPTPAVLSAPAYQSGGVFQCTVATTANFTNIVEASSDLSVWSPIATNVPSAASFSFTDTNVASQTRRFYRVIQTGAAP